MRHLPLVCLTVLLQAFPVLAAEKNAGDAVFGVTKVVQFHLTMDAKQFSALTPTGGGGFGGFGPPGGGPNRQPPEGRHRNTFGVEFPWAKGDLTLDGKTCKDVGVRYKGNYTYMATARSLKKSLKIDIDSNVKGQKLDGLTKLNFHCGVSDPTRAREAFAYAYFRAAGVPAPRTAFAELTLTVPGKYEKEYVGVYTLVEQVNRGFLERHFKNGKGMLLKPENLQGGLAHLGSDWKAYEGRYKPKDSPTDAQKKRLIDFTRLINSGTDADFEKEIGSYLDIEAFLKFIATNALLSNLDSFLGYGHNYYLYLVPQSDRFVFIPWDLDLSLSTWPAAGTPEQQVELSIHHPHAGQNKLIDRLFAIKEHKERYLAILKDLAATSFTKEKLLRELDGIEQALKEPLAKEVRAVSARREGGGGGGGFGGGFPGGGQFGQSMPPRRFIEKRTASVADQLAGKAKGFEPRPFGAPGGGGFGPPGGGGFGPPPGGFGGPQQRIGELLPRELVDRIELTAEQRQKMTELQKEVEERLKKILTEKQNSELKRMRDFRPGGGFGPPPGGGFFPGGGR